MNCSGVKPPAIILILHDKPLSLFINLLRVVLCLQFSDLIVVFSITIDLSAVAINSSPTREDRPAERTQASANWEGQQQADLDWNRHHNVTHHQDCNPDGRQADNQPS